MCIKKLHLSESGPLTYEQLGFDLYQKDNSNVAGLDHIIIYAGEGTDSSNVFYANMPGPDAHWIGIHNAGNSGSTDEVIPIQAESLVGNDISKTGEASYNVARYLELASMDIIYGKFTSVGILKSGPPTNPTYYVRLIRGV